MTERELQQTSRALVVFNPRSGRAQEHELRAALERHFGGAGRSYEVFTIEGEAGAEAAVQTAIAEGCDLVVAVGGDGTISTVAGAVAGTGVPLGVIPTGTANVFARELGIPITLDEAVALLAGAYAVTSVDSMRVRGRHAALQIGVGVDALMIRDTPHDAKGRFGRLAYLWTALTALLGFQPQRFTLVIDGERHRLHASQILIANGGALGVDMVRWGPDISPADGQVDICVVNARTLADYLWVLWHAITGTHRRDRRLRYFRARQAVSINARRALPVQADGEIIGVTPVQIEVDPGALRVAVPVQAQAPAAPPAPIPSGVVADPATRAVAAEVEGVLARRIQEIRSPEHAETVAEELLAAAEGTSAMEQREAAPPAADPARAIEEQARAPGSQPPADALLTAAEEVARSSGARREALEHAVTRATNPEEHGALDPALIEPLGLLREAILRRMAPWQALDARLFLAVNHLPHTAHTNRLMYGLTTVMNAGMGWVGGLLVAAALDRPRGWRALRGVTPVLWGATMIVEYPVKAFFRRRRPFIDIVQAISVGKKPGTYSFPSGHSAAAFAGAWLIARHYPRLAPLWYAVAGAVGFSRVYLGAHYPGDVLSGATIGVLLAAGLRRALRALRVRGA